MEANTEKDQRIIAIAKEFSNIPWCEQYERMISGMLYDSFVPPLEDSRFRAKKIINKFNAHFPEDATFRSLAADREKMAAELFGRLGKRTYFEPPLFVDYGCNISIGDDFYGNLNMCVLDCGLVNIGDRVLFGPSVHIYAATHETAIQSRREGIEFAREVSIGNDCWIGGNTTILAGVSIGNGCTIGAGSVVTKSIPPYSVAVGCPARVIKKVERVPGETS